MVIHTEGLAKTFTTRRGAVEAVAGVDIDIDAGELVGFLGPNGAGKTTTLRMLTTLLRPSAGSATVAGRDLRADPVGVRRRIGYVAQSGGVSDESVLGEELILQGRLYGLSAAEGARRAGELTGRLDLAGLAQRKVKTLSGGQRRRLDIAMGLIHSPALVFLDEPTTGLDPQARSNLWEHIRSLRESSQTTVFLTTHYLDEADELCDRVLVIDGGRIVAEGGPAELKARVSGDAINLGFAEPAHAARAALLVGGLPDTAEVEADGTAIRFRVPRGDTALADLVGRLHAADLSPTSISVHQPSQDDVFLTMTGRSLRDAEEVAAA
jgi:ABC-2 type transport system ATP-binding protein